MGLRARIGVFRLVGIRLGKIHKVDSLSLIDSF